MSAGADTNPAAVGRTGTALLLTAEQLGNLLNVGRSTIWRLNSAGKLPMPVQIGRATRWRVAEIEEWVRAGCPSRDRWNGYQEE